MVTAPLKILFLSRWFPYPPDNGSKIRIYNLLKVLSNEHRVDLLSFSSEKLAPEHLSVLLNICREVQVIDFHPRRSAGFQAWVHLLSPTPRAYLEQFSVEMQRRVVSTFEREQYDVVIASQIDMAPYVLSLVEVPKIFEELELTTIYDAFIQSDNPAKRLRYGLTWLKTSRYTARLLRQFDGCTVVSEVEKRRVEMAAPNYRQVCVVPNGVDVPDNPINRALLEADSLVYSGSLTYGPNYDAIAFFLSEIFPLIRVQRPNVRLYITGKLDEALLDSLPDREGVVFTGYLPDVQSRVSRAWASVVPLRSGGGTRLKILEALGLGVPVITTSKGMEGLDLIPEKDILVADEAPEFASAVVEVLSSPKRREQLSRAGMEAVRRSYDWRLIGPQFCRYVEKIAESGR